MGKAERQSPQPASHDRPPSGAIEKVTIRGVEVTLATPDDHRAEWVDYNEYRLPLEAP